MLLHLQVNSLLVYQSERLVLIPRNYYSYSCPAGADTSVRFPNCS